MLNEAIEIHRSLRRIDCARRAFVLTAVGIPNEVAPVLPWRGWSLWVSAAQVTEARSQLAQYQAEQLRFAAAHRAAQQMPSRPARPGAWLGALGYALVLLVVAAAVSTGFGRLDAFEAGTLDAARVRSGEWWRAWTALTLHVDAAHITANLGAGIWFGWLAGQLAGPGTAWLLIVLGAGLANLIEGLAAAPGYRSVGASTAVFTALGLMSAWSWREHRHLWLRWPSRLAPLVAGVVLLGWLGTSGEHTDVMGHLLGFAVGVALGATRHVRALARLPQWLAGAVALGVIAVAWAWACA